MSETAADAAARLPAVATAASGLAVAAQAVLRAMTSRSSGVPDREWIAFLEADLGKVALEEREALESVLERFGWREGRFESPPNLEELRGALPVFTRRVDAKALLDEDRHEFERRVTKFINKVSPRNARQAAEAFCQMGWWSEGEERVWRLHAFAAQLLRSFARLARFRPSRGNLAHDLSILSSQVSAVCELLIVSEGLREAIDLWIISLLGCQRFWKPMRLAVCGVQHRLQQKGAGGLGLLPSALMRRVLSFVYPETLPVQEEVTKVLPPHAEATEVAIVFGHLLWSCPPCLWEAWSSVAVDCVEAMLLSPGEAELHHAGIVLFAVCGRLTREPPQVEAVLQHAISLGQQLSAVAERRGGAAAGFVRHRIASAVEAARAVQQHQAFAGGLPLVDLEHGG